jgi:glycosyltransferase involved in cell wall biosynthesis
MFSVVVPLWNKRHTVEATIASALAQTWSDFELIVVDDGSTDGGMALLDRFDDRRIRRIIQSNAGPGGARNAGLRVARGEWIAFLDADDIWLPDHLAELARVRSRHPDSGLIAASFLCKPEPQAWFTPASGHDRIEVVDYLERAMLFTTSSVAISKDTYRSLGGFTDAPIGQDIEYWARIALQRPIAVSSRVTTYYLLGTGGISETLRSPCFGRAVHRAADIAPCVETLLEGYCRIASAERRRIVDRFIDRQFQYCVRRSARIGDYRTLRALPPLFLRPPAFEDRLIVAAARLPAPLAQFAYRVGFGLKRLIRALRRTDRVTAPGWRAAGRRHAGG